MTVYSAEEYSVPDLKIENKKIPDSESFRFVNNMGAGFNLGNTFDAIDNSGAVEGDANMYLETEWLSDKEAGVTTYETIDAVKKAGFKTIRIPVSWHNHIDSDFNINQEWLSKVSKIVKYALSQDMYVILNIHHDNEKASGFTSPDYDPSWAAGNKIINGIIESGKYHDVIIDDISYRHFLAETDGFRVHIFINNKLAEQSNKRLLVISVISGGGILVFVFILIYFVSGKAIKPIKESYKKQNEFISNASHELKTPITVISATTQLMEKKFGTDRLLGCIQVQSQRMSRLVNEMLTLTRVSNLGKQLNEFTEFDISMTIKKNVLYFEGRAFEEGKEIVTDIEENLMFTGNQNKIDELIGILLDNALKYSDEKSAIKIGLHSEKEHIILSCENKCEDFDEKELPHLFERFYLGDKSHSEAREGFGLGLSIAEEIVAIHKGSINTEYKDSFVIFRIVL